MKCGIPLYSSTVFAPRYAQYGGRQSKTQGPDAAYEVKSDL